MQDYTIIFIGKAGCGKGTQIKMLETFLESKGENSIVSVEPGQGFRDFINSDTYTSKLVKEIPLQGKLQPAFLAIWLWVDKMIKSFTGQKILFIDGAPRKLDEAHFLNEMLDFYKRENRYVIDIEVSDEWSKERLLNRGRGDDIHTDSVNRRLEWFRQNSPEILSFFEETGKYKMIKINGEQSVYDVQKDILKALEL